MSMKRISWFAFAVVGICLLSACTPVARGQEPILTRDNVCHFYGQASQGGQAWNKDESCTVPRLELLDTSYHQGDFVCCGGGAGSPTTNRDIPAGLEVVVTGGHDWSVRDPKLQGNQFFLHTYCGPEPPPGPGCNVNVVVWVHYRVMPQATQGNEGGGATPVRAHPNDDGNKDTGKESSKKVENGFGSWDKILAVGFGFFFAIILLLIAKFEREPTPLGILIYRVVLALVAAGIGAVIPGMIDVNVQPFVRAGGAIALFVIVFWFNPPNLVTSAPKPAPHAMPEESRKDPKP